MNYTERLNTLIDASGLMLKEIAEACQKLGVNLTNTYLSSLKTTPGKIASDDISRAIAKVCGAKYEDILVVQAYLDRAPDVFVNFVDNVKLIIFMAKNFLESTNKNNDALKQLLSGSYNDKEIPLADIICEINAVFENVSDVNLFENMLNRAADELSKPKCMVIPADVVKQIKLVDESKLNL